MKTKTINLYVLAFCVASAWFFSNVNIGGVKLNHLFTLLTIAYALLLSHARDYQVIILVASVIFLSTIPGAINENYFTNYVYKVLSFLPVVILARRASANTIFYASLHSFLLSTLIAISLLMLGFSNDTFIVYPDFIPRFAGLAIEPVSYALGAVFIYIFYILSFGSPASKIKLLFYLPIISSVSTVIFLKIAIDFLLLRKIHKFFVLLPLVLLVHLLFEHTRVSESIDVRLSNYLNVLKGVDLIFFGTGFYLHELSGGLPGIFRVYFELGVMTLFLLVISYIYLFIRFKVYNHPWLIIGMALPLILEGFGAPFLWLASVFCIVRGSHCLKAINTTVKFKCELKRFSDVSQRSP